MSTSTARYLIAVLIAGLAFFVRPERGDAAGPVTILANPGAFGSVERAAASEDRVDWWDEDPTDDRACTESFAAVELRRFLARASHYQERDIHLAAPDDLPPRGHVFLLGTRASNPLIDAVAGPAGKQPRLDGPASFHIRSFVQDGRTITVIEGGGRTGVLYGVYAYLEKTGIGFFGLGEQGTVYPSRRAALPKDVAITENPHYLTRGFWSWEDRGDETFFLWMARNRLNFWNVEEKEYPFLKKLGMTLTAGQHDIQERFLNPGRAYPYNCPQYRGDEEKPHDPYPPSSASLGDANKDGTLSYAEAHPEWFAMLNGKRSAHKHRRLAGNFCTANTSAVRELAKNLIQCLIDGDWAHADMVNFWMLDGGTWCQCEACTDLGTPTDRLLQLMHAVTGHIRTARRQGRLKRRVSLVSLAYLETRAPPTKPLPEDFDYDSFSMTFFPIFRCYAHPFADPACTECNQLLLRHYQGWTAGQGRYYKGSMFIGEYYNVSNIKSLPVLFPRIMAVDLPWYYRNGARHFHYMHAPTRLWGTWTLNQYLMARLLWNTDADTNALLDDYFTRYYPSTTASARSFYHHLERATASIKPVKHYIRIRGGHRGRYTVRFGLTNDSMDLFPTKHLHYESYHPLTDDGLDLVEMVESMRLARADLDAALQACTVPVEKARLLEDERRFAYGEAMVMFYYHVIRTAMFHRQGKKALARQEFAMADRLAERLRTIVDLVQVASSHANAANGYEASYLQGAYELYKKHYGRTADAKEKK